MALFFATAARVHAGADVYGADFTNALVDRTMQIKLCRYADGVNPTTGADTRKSLGCGSRRAFRVRAACCALSGQGLFCYSELLANLLWALYHPKQQAYWLTNRPTVCRPRRRPRRMGLLYRKSRRMPSGSRCQVTGIDWISSCKLQEALQSVLPMSLSAGHSAGVHTQQNIILPHRRMWAQRGSEMGPTPEVSGCSAAVFADAWRADAAGTAAPRTGALRAMSRTCAIAALLLRSSGCT